MDEAQEKDGNTVEEIEIEAEEGEILTLDTRHPPKDNEDRILLFISFREPLNLSPTHLISKTLKSNLCQPISKPLLNAPNYELRVLKEVVQSKTKKSPMSNIQTRKGKVKKRVSKYKRDLFSWFFFYFSQE